MHGMQQDSLAEYTSTVQSDGLIIQSGAHVCVSTRVIQCQHTMLQSEDNQLVCC